MTMNSSILTFGASLLLATSVLAFPNPDRSNLEAETFVPPQPIHTVAPEIADRHAGRLIKVRLTVDSDGQPHDVRVVNSMEEMLIDQIVRAVSEWEFTPGTRDGVAIDTRVVLPLQVRLGRAVENQESMD
jgi:TonB family protein